MEEEKEETMADILKRQLEIWRDVLLDPGRHIPNHIHREIYDEQKGYITDPVWAAWRDKIVSQANDRISFLRKALKNA